MARLLILIALGAVVWWLWRRFLRPRRPSAAPPPPTPEAMVRCVHCGIHIPRKEALAQGTHWYCCREHLPQDADSEPRD